MASSSGERVFHFSLSLYEIQGHETKVWKHHKTHQVMVHHHQSCDCAMFPGEIKVTISRTKPTYSDKEFLMEH